VDTTTWTATPTHYWSLEPGDRITRNGVVETVVDAEYRSDDYDSWMTIGTDGPLLGGVYYAADQVEVLAPPEPVDGYRLARQPADWVGGLSACTCLYRRPAGTGGGWSRLTVDPMCPEHPARDRTEPLPRW
jgi:hypothetical protein